MASDALFTALIRRECDRLGWPWFTGGEYNLNLFGVRGFSRQSNLFDDLLGCGLTLHGREVLYLWPGTTDPGRPYLENPMRPEGTAILCDGYYPGLWEIGTHNKGKPTAYTALTQTGTARVWRDNNRDDVLDLTGPTTTDVSGVNQHRAGADSPVVNRWSAACQVHKRADTFELLMELARKQVALRGWKKFSYKLFDVAKSPTLSELFTVSL